MRRYFYGALFLAAAVTASLFAMLPITQYLTGFKPPDRVIRDVSIALPPPPPPPPDPPPPPEVEDTEPPPQMQQPVQTLSLAQLNTAINPGVGAALVGDFSLEGVGTMEASETLKDLETFELSELDELPAFVGNRNPPPMRFSRQQQRDDIEAQFLFEVNILPTGRVKVIRMVEGDRTKYNEGPGGYIEKAIAFVETNYRYTAPTVNGKPVTAKYQVPLKVDPRR